MSNAEIVEDVFRNYKIKGLIRKMIDYSSKDGSDNDLEMYIYEYLLNYNNEKLNSMYFNGKNTKNPNKQSTKLRNFISQIIKLQRNGGKNGSNTPYVNELRIKNNNEFFYEHTNIPDKNTYDYKPDIIVDYINGKISNRSKHTTIEELNTLLSFVILQKYYQSDLKLAHLADNLDLSRATVNKLMKVARKDIVNWWNNKGNYLDEN